MGCQDHCRIASLQLKQNNWWTTDRSLKREHKIEWGNMTGQTICDRKPGLRWRIVLRSPSLVFKLKVVNSITNKVIFSSWVFNYPFHCVCLKSSDRRTVPKGHSCLPNGSSLVSGLLEGPIALSGDPIETEIAVSIFSRFQTPALTTASFGLWVLTPPRQELLSHVSIFVLSLFCLE